MEQGERYALWPAAFVDGVFSVPDELLSALWWEMVDKGKHRQLFYNGAIRDDAGWIGWVKDPDNYVVLVVDQRRVKVACVAWINHAVDGAALAHFCMLGLPRVEIGKTVLKYWSALPGIHVLVGFTPETNTGAVRYAKSIGFKESGLIPAMCNMVYEGRRVGAVVTAYLTR